MHPRTGRGVCWTARGTGGGRRGSSPSVVTTADGGDADPWPPRSPLPTLTPTPPRDWFARRVGGCSIAGGLGICMRGAVPMAVAGLVLPALRMIPALMLALLLLPVLPRRPCSCSVRCRGCCSMIVLVEVGEGDDP